MKMTLRPITYMVTREQLDKIDETEEYLDLITLGSLFNAICYARSEGASYQLASFSLDHNAFRETLFLTGGLLYKAFNLGEMLIDRYRDKPFVNDFEGLLDSFTEYKPPEVLLDMRSNGPFRISSKKREITFDLTGKHDLFHMFVAGQRGFAVAMIADADATMEKLKRGDELETHRDLESVVDYLIDEFAIAAEEFIFAIAKQLGLKAVTPKPAQALRLAA